MTFKNDVHEACFQGTTKNSRLGMRCACTITKTLALDATISEPPSHATGAGHDELHWGFDVHAPNQHAQNFEARKAMLLDTPVLGMSAEFAEIYAYLPPPPPPPRDQLGATTFHSPMKPNPRIVAMRKKCRDCQEWKETKQYAGARGVRCGECRRRNKNTWWKSRGWWITASSIIMVGLALWWAIMMRGGGGSTSEVENKKNKPTTSTFPVVTPEATWCDEEEMASICISAVTSVTSEVYWMPNNV
ncbi:hypothetical protein AC579_7677 [Pseudocercospora musae]|uniref:Uncharacterized protein n=1 Tax=Pseudocercospora musae TaxID=113226 RepID=A0A139GT35_9PEZI|nr:hypothetical protein AC579_7677 [Pseudocercospora musae]